MYTRRIAPLLVLTVLAGCADHDPPTAESPSQPATVPMAAPGAALASPRSDEAHLEALARRVARAMNDSGFRAYVKAELDRSAFAEHKVQFQRFLGANGGRAIEALAAASGETTDAVAADTGAVALEMYFPVPAHRAAWSGGTHLLVATAIADHEAPIAFDPTGRRQLLDPARPPATPVLAIVPMETDFSAMPRPARATCTGDACGGTGGGGISPAVGTVGGLYLTYAQYTDSFEGWLKGSPEFEIHIMGPAEPGDTANLASFQCVGEHAAAPYAWDMNDLTWSGSQLLFSNAQMDAFSRAYAGRAFVIFALEDDDTACGIRTDSNRGNELLKAIGDAYRAYKAAKDSTVLSLSGAQRLLRAAKSGSNFLSAAYSFLKSNDDIIGIAVSDEVRGRYSPTTNWTVLDKTLATTAAFKLEMH